LVRTVEESEAHLASELAKGLARPEEHYKGRALVLGTLRPEYREHRPESVAVTAMQALTSHLREVRGLVEARHDAPQLRVLDAEARVLPAPDADD